MVWSGLPDPGETRTQLRSDSDSEQEDLDRFILAWEELDVDRNGLTVAEAIKKSESPIGPKIPIERIDPRVTSTCREEECSPRKQTQIIQRSNLQWKMLQNQTSKKQQSIKSVVCRRSGV